MSELLCKIKLTQEQWAIVDPLDFIWLNQVSWCANGCNRGRPKTNTSGYKGVSWDTQRNRWQAGISSNGVRISLGRFDRKEDAYAAYCEAAQRLHGTFARVR